MRKMICALIIVAGGFLFQANVARAQYGVGSNVVNIGIGFGDPVDYGGSSSPVFSASIEHGSVKLGPGWAGTLGLGGILSYQHASSSFTYPNYFGNPPTVITYSYSSIFIGARGTWHPDLSEFMDMKKIDLYAGLDLGFLIVTASSSETGPSFAGSSSAAVGSGLRGGIIVGGRYYFTDNVAGFIELGYDVTADAKLGVAFNFGGR